MTPEMKLARLKAARRDQHFTNAPMGIGQCGLRAPEVAIFPVRYALDESPTVKDTPQGPHPLPKGWRHDMPALKTRSYTLRQLRDGWVYVWNSVDETFHEYQVVGEQFIRHKWTEAQLNSNVRNNPGPALTYLLYPRRSQLRMAFSAVQWTWRTCELMRSNTEAQQRWMRPVDLPGFCSSGTLEHGARITSLGQSVADILVCYEPEENAPAFTSTMLPTRPNEPGSPCKPAFEEPLVRGLVPEQDTALFVALDDPLAMIDDLKMNLTGRRVEQALFNDEHGQKLDSARTVVQLCGIDIDTLMPATVTKAQTAQQQEWRDDFYLLIQAYSEVEQRKALGPRHEQYMVDSFAYTKLAADEMSYKDKWGRLPTTEQREQVLKQWNEREAWRTDVHFDEARQYLALMAPQASRLEAHCDRSEQDLVAWLDRLPPTALAIFHDPVEETQACPLLNSANSLYTLLGNGTRGQGWLYRQAVQPSSLFGLAPFNFSAEISTLIRQVTDTFSRTGKLDEAGRQGDGSSSAMSLSPGDLTSAATRANELKGVLDLPAVSNSWLFQTMSEQARAAFSTLAQIANQQASAAWHGLVSMLVPAFKGQTALTYSALVVVFSREFGRAPQLLANLNYELDIRTWQQKLKSLTLEMHLDIRALTQSSSLYEHRGVRLSLQNREAQLKQLFLERPNRIIASTASSSLQGVETDTLRHWLANLGSDEVASQHRGVGNPEDQKRIRSWFGQNLGNALPVVVMGLNLWNLHSSAEKVWNDGHFNADEWRILSANAAYAGNAIAALWVGPAWSRAGSMVAELDGTMTKLARAGYLEWLSESRRGTASGAQARQFAAASKSLVLRTATWAALGAMASGLEAWQTYKDSDNATSPEEQTLLKYKAHALTAMSSVSTGQLASAVLGIRFGYVWLMSTPVIIALLVLGVAYLLLSAIANSYKREGLRLWLYRCTWGRGADLKWQGEGYSRQVAALLFTLQRPTVLGKALFTGGGSTPRNHLGFWLQIQVPATLAGKPLTLQPALVETSMRGNKLRDVDVSFYYQFFDGHWIDPELLGTLPDGPKDEVNRTDFIYTEAHQYRLWQVWIHTSAANPVLELEIRYPKGLYGGDHRPSYMFRLQMKWAASEADRMNKPFNGELKEGEDLLLHHQATRLLSFDVADVPRREASDA